MDPFAAALDALFNAPGSSAAIFTAYATNEPQPIRVIHGRPDKTVGFGDGQIVEGTNIFEVRLSDVPEPERDDTIEMGERTYRLVGEAIVDVEGLSWTMGAVETT